jgi:hypothetical protein
MLFLIERDQFDELKISVFPRIFVTCCMFHLFFLWILHRLCMQFISLVRLLV